MVLHDIASALDRLDDILERTNELLAIDRNRPDTTDEIARLSRATAENYNRIMELTLAVDEGVRSVARAEKRVAKTVQVARRQLAEGGMEHPGLDAEAAELRDRDGDPVEEDNLPSVPEGVEEAFLVLSTGIPGYEG